jgi:hypothetical protein
MDAVSDLLQATRLSGGVFLDAEFTAPWCVHSGVTAEECAQFELPAAHVIAYHYICGGRMMLELDDHKPVAVESGEIVLLPHNEPHRLCSGLGLYPVDVESEVVPGSNGSVSKIVYGGGGAQTRMLCGFLANELQSDPIIRVLPRVLKVRIADALPRTATSTTRGKTAARTGHPYRAHRLRSGLRIRVRVQSRLQA